MFSRGLAASQPPALSKAEAPPEPKVLVLAPLELFQLLLLELFQLLLVDKLLPV